MVNVARPFASFWAQHCDSAAMFTSFPWLCAVQLVSLQSSQLSQVDKASQWKVKISSNIASLRQRSDDTAFAWICLSLFYQSVRFSPGRVRAAPLGPTRRAPRPHPSHVDNRSQQRHLISTFTTTMNTTSTTTTTYTSRTEKIKMRRTNKIHSILRTFFQPQCYVNPWVKEL